VEGEEEKEEKEEAFSGKEEAIVRGMEGEKEGHQFKHT